MSEKIVKYEYEYGLCKRMHYRGLWCVRYEGVPGHFEKAGMACSCAVLPVSAVIFSIFQADCPAYATPTPDQ